MRKLKKKQKRVLLVSLLFLLGIGLTALIGYGSSGFSKWDKESWKERFVISQVEEEDDDEADDTASTTDTTPEPSGSESE
ncbi:MAG: hypothetical protein M0Q41_13585 [Bacteroidales bacterium]|nr:hypothetical protein [Bacteroidales bacterium]